MIKALAASVMSLAVLVSVVGVANADTLETCSTIKAVAYNDNASGGKQLYIICGNDNTTYSAYVAAPAAGTACPLYAADTVKAWQALALAAKLAGKSINIYWVQCGTGKSPTDIEFSP
jgi:hypothetical protein